MNKDFSFNNYVTINIGKDESAIILRSIEQLNENAQVLMIPNEIDGNRLVLIDEHALMDVSADLISVPSGITLAKNVFSPNLKMLYVSPGITPIGLTESLSSKDTLLLFGTDCAERRLMHNMGYKTAVADMPVNALIVDATVNKYDMQKEGRSDKERTIEKSLADRFFKEQNFEQEISEQIQNKTEFENGIDEISSTR